MISAQSTIYIVGLGAIGKALAVFLTRAGRKVVIIRGSTDDGSRRIERLRVEMTDGERHEAEVEVATLSAYPTLEGLIILATKSYGNEYLATVLKGKVGSSPLVLLQNGLGVERPFVDQGFPEVYRGVLFATSQNIGEEAVRFKSVSACPVGIANGFVNHLDRIVQLMHTEKIEFRKEDNIQPVIWKKTIINCVFNTICPILETDNGIFHRDTRALEMARRVMAECEAVAREKGILLSLTELEESLLRISSSSDGQLISTLQDIRSQRRTELETLNFEMVRIARILNMEEQVSLTRLLGELTAMKAELARQPYS